MKLKKLFAALSAAMLFCCAFGGTAFAEETEPVDYSRYQIGDITMDGVVDIEDAQLALRIYTDLLAKRDIFASNWMTVMTEERLALGNVDGKSREINGVLQPVDLFDAQWLMNYYLDMLSQKIGPEAADEYIRKKVREIDEQQLAMPPKE